MKKIIGLLVMITILASILLVPIGVSAESKLLDDFESYTIGDIARTKLTDGLWATGAGSNVDGFFIAQTDNSTIAHPDGSTPSKVLGIGKSGGSSATSRLYVQKNSLNFREPQKISFWANMGNLARPWKVVLVNYANSSDVNGNTLTLLNKIGSSSQLTYCGSTVEGFTFAENTWYYFEIYTQHPWVLSSKMTIDHALYINGQCYASGLFTAGVNMLSSSTNNTTDTVFSSAHFRIDSAPESDATLNGNIYMDDVKISDETVFFDNFERHAVGQLKRTALTAAGSTSLDPRRWTPGDGATNGIGGLSVFQTNNTSTITPPADQNASKVLAMGYSGGGTAVNPWLQRSALNFREPRKISFWLNYGDLSRRTTFELRGYDDTNHVTILHKSAADNTLYAFGNTLKLTAEQNKWYHFEIYTRNPSVDTENRGTIEYAVYVNDTLYASGTWTDDTRCESSANADTVFSSAGFRVTAGETTYTPKEGDDIYLDEVVITKDITWPDIPDYNFKLTNASGGSDQLTAGENTVELNDVKFANGVFITALYYDDALQEVYMQNIAEAALGQCKQTINISSETNDLSKYELKCFVWNDMNSMQPIIAAAQMPGGTASTAQ